MKEFTRCNKKYFKDNENLYMVCTVFGPRTGSYLWEIHISDGDSVYRWFDEFAHGGCWENCPENAINEAIKILKENFPNVTEVNYTEGNLCLAGNFKYHYELKEEILALIRKHYPEITPYFD